MDIPTHAELVEKIDLFLERHNFAPTRLGREATGEPNLIPSIKAGRQPNLDTLNRLCRVMADYDAKLPAEVEHAPEWPIASANNGGKNITGQPGPPAEAGEAVSPGPFSPTSSATSAPAAPAEEVIPSSSRCSSGPTPAQPEAAAP